MVDKGVHFEDAVREFEKRFITRVLSRWDGSLTKTADALGIHRNTLSRKMERIQNQTRRGIGLPATCQTLHTVGTPPLTLPIAAL